MADSGERSTLDIESLTILLPNYDSGLCSAKQCCHDVFFKKKIIKRNTVLQFISALGVPYCVLSLVTRASGCRPCYVEQLRCLLIQVHTLDIQNVCRGTQQPLPARFVTLCYLETNGLPG